MAYHPRMTRLGLRITIAALEVYLCQLHDDALTSAENTLKELNYHLDSANIERYGKAVDVPFNTQHIGGHNESTGY